MWTSGKWVEMAHLPLGLTSHLRCTSFLETRFSKQRFSKQQDDGSLLIESDTAVLMAAKFDKIR